MRSRIAKMLVVSGSVVVAALLGACSSGASSREAAAGPPAPDASSYQSYGMRVSRPEGWSWVPTDASLTPDTLVVLQGPVGDDQLAPAVEIGRRPLDARTQRRSPASILTQLVAELTQTAEAFEMIGTPAEIQVAGKPAAEVRLKITETLDDGQSVQRDARFYGVVHGGSIFLFRCLGAPDGSHDSQFDAVMGSVAFDA